MRTSEVSVYSQRTSGIKADNLLSERYITMELYNYLKDHTDIIAVAGINWGTLYLTDHSEVEDVRKLMDGRFSVTGPWDTIPAYESSVINNAFVWFTNSHKPTVKERERLLKWLDKVEESGEHTGIDQSAYPVLRARLFGLTDLEDKQYYEIHYHY